ncbi:CBS domain-containing protein [Streptomyces sp. NPDC094438]|uniref:CBS domain-containing protein n=1 Tax=Streptomyces sp. NPDC094438 TaxID=3366061 RepID=UPI00382DFAC5
MKHSKIGSVMTTEVVTVRSATPFKDVARLLGRHHISGLPVIDADDKVIGVISETDLLVREADAPDPHQPERRFRLPRITPAGRNERARSQARTAGQLMSQPPVCTRAENTIAEAARCMARHKVERLPVIDDEDRLVGIVTRRDLLQLFLRTDDEIRREVIAEVLVNTLWLAPQTITVSVADGVVTLDGKLERLSEVPIAVNMTRQIDGVVAVDDKLTYHLDDSHLRPAEQALHGVTEEWLRKL